MSLKAFHFFFILVCIVFSAYFGSWCFNNYEDTSSQLIFALGVGSLTMMVGLVGYLVWFLRKSKGYSFLGLTLMIPFYSSDLFACAVCSGNPNHPMTRAANQGVWFLLVVISGVLVCFATLFLFWIVRSRRFASGIDVRLSAPGWPAVSPKI